MAQTKLGQSAESHSVWWPSENTLFGRDSHSCHWYCQLWACCFAGPTKMISHHLAHSGLLCCVVFLISFHLFSHAKNFIYIFQVLATFLNLCISSIYSWKPNKKCFIHFIKENLLIFKRNILSQCSIGEKWDPSLFLVLFWLIFMYVFAFLILYIFLYLLFT